MGAEIGYMLFSSGGTQVTSLSCNAHDSAIENLEDSEHGFSRFFVFTSADDSRIFYTCCIETDVEGEDTSQDLPYHWIVL